MNLPNKTNIRALEQVETMSSVARNFDPVSDTKAVIEPCHSMSKIVFTMHEKSRDNGTEKGDNVGGAGTRMYVGA